MSGLDAGNLIAILIGTLTQIGVLMSFRVSLENRLTKIETILKVDDLHGH